jgi:hypothetical protein
MALHAGKKIDMVGAQGTIINYELSELATNVRVATDA